MITALREQLATDLAEIEGLTVYSSWPDRFSTPCVQVVPPANDSYVTAGKEFGGSYIVACDVLLLVSRGSHNVVLPMLEALIDDVLRNTTDWGLAGVDSPSTVTIGSVEHLGTIVHLTKQTNL